MPSRLKTALQIAVLLLALFFLGGVLATQGEELRSYDWRLDPPLTGLACGVLVVGSLADIGLWRSILLRIGGGSDLRFGRAARIWFLSNVVRYIPGNVWQFLGMIHLCSEEGIGKMQTLTSILVHQALSNLAGLLVAGAYFALTRQSDWLGRVGPFLALAPLALVAIHPAVLERIINFALVRLGRAPIRIGLTFPTLLLLLAGYAVTWLVYGTAFAALVRAVTPVGWTAAPHLIATFAAAYVIGFLSLLTPSGLGVREGVMVALLSTTLPLAVATVVAIIARLWLVIFDLAGAGLALLTGGLPRREVADV